MTGEIHLIIGPMFSGKTTELYKNVERYRLANLKCVYVKHGLDTRYSDEYLMTHDKRCHEEKTLITDILMNIFNDVTEFDCIGIDEGQFFKDIIVFSEKLANLGKLVIIAGLDGDSNRKPFGDICSLIPLCEKISKLKAVCLSCHKDASFTKSIKSKTDVIDVGGNEKYSATCRSCYFK